MIPSTYGVLARPEFDPYVIKVKTDNLSTGSSASNQFRIPCTGSGYSFTVDWGDGNTSNHFGSPGNITHTYTTAGTYVIAIYGLFPRIFFNNGGDRLKLLEVMNWGSILWGATQTASYWGCANMNVTAVDTPIFSNPTTNLNSFFRGCSNLTNTNGSINNWNMSNVTNIGIMFAFATTFNQSLNNWNTSGITNMANTFEGAAAFNGDISSWDTSNVTSMNFMFNFATSFNQNIGSWTTSSVSNMSSMFNGASAFNQNIGSWNVNTVTNFNGMFLGATSFNNGGSSSINGWNIRTTGTVTMAQMFQNASAFNQNIGSWNTSNVTTMANMFNATNFNQNIGSWNTAAVTNMSSMFSGASAFNQNIGSWDVSNVTTMGSMFRNATAFNQDLGSWNLRTAGVVLDRVFELSGMNTTNYTATIVGWANYVYNNAGTPPSLSMTNQGAARIYTTANAGGANFANAGAARTYLTTALPHPTGAGWTISGDTVI